MDTVELPLQVLVPTKTEMEQADALLILRQDIVELHTRIDNLQQDLLSQGQRLLSALTDKDEMYHRLRIETKDATRWRAAQAVFNALANSNQE